MDILFAETEADRQALFRHRYEIYIGEMRRYRKVADHAARIFREPDDETSRLSIGRIDGEIAASMRWTWGGDGPFPERIIEQYRMQPFLDRYPAEHMIVGERFTVAKPFRGGEVLFRMFEHYLRFANEHRIQFLFGDCEPHLLNLYLGLGFRTYSTRNISTPEAGYLIPMVLVAEDLDYLRSIGSPVVEVLTDFGAEARVPADLADLLDHGAITSQRLVPRDRYWREVRDAFAFIDRTRPQIFDGIEEERVYALLEKSNVIECRAGDHLLKKGNVAQNMYVILDGAVEVRDGDRILSVLGPGDLLGEFAFLMRAPRSADVFAASDGTRLLSFSESTLRQAIDRDPDIAARMLLNVSRLLCEKILAGN